jgi:hypothetical protein
MTEQITFTPEQQAQVDKLVGDARVKAREKATAEASDQRTKDKETADQADLAASKEWEKLAKTHEAKVKELEPMAETLKSYATFVESALDTTVKKMGKAAKTAVAGLPDGMTAMDKLAWLNTNETLFQQQTGDGVGTPKSSKTLTKRETTTAPKNRYGSIKL